MTSQLCYKMLSCAISYRSRAAYKQLWKQHTSCKPAAWVRAIFYTFIDMQTDYQCGGGSVILPFV